MEDSHFAILLLVVGLGLMVAEIFIPTGGILGFLVALCLARSLWYAWSAWWESNPTAWWSFLLVELLLVPMTIGAAFYALPRTSFGKKVLLEGPQLDDVKPYAKEHQHLLQQVGQPGRTLTLLNPGGMVLVNGERFHCESEGMMIDPDTDVRIVGVSSLRLMVRMSSPDDASDSDSDFADSEKPPLDFDIPQS